MSAFVTIALILALSAVFRFVNEKVLRLESSIGLMLLALGFSLVMGGLAAVGVTDYLIEQRELVARLNLNDTLLNGVLCFMLFAGSVNVKIGALREERWVILSLAIGATLIAWMITGALIWGVAAMFGRDFPPIYAFLFGALISPTDPIAALAILGKVGLPERLEAIINGESLFNDGVGVVLFAMCLAIATGPAAPTVSGALTLFLREVLGGVVLGLLTAGLTHWMLLRTEEYGSQILIALAAVAVGYGLAERIEVSGPIATVTTGLVIGNLTRPQLRAVVRERFDTFWDGIDEVLNAIVFVLIGLHVVLVHHVAHVPAAMTAILVCLVARAVSVFIPITLLTMTSVMQADRWGLTKLLTWGGLRGGLALAMALSLPDVPEKGGIVFMTYAVVAFTIIVQGLTVARIFKAEAIARLLR